MRWLIGGLLALVGLVALVAAGAYFALKRPDLAEAFRRYLEEQRLS